MCIFPLWLVLRFFLLWFSRFVFLSILCSLGFTELAEYMDWHRQLFWRFLNLSLNYFFCPLLFSSPWIPSTCMLDHLILSCRYRTLFSICPSPSPIFLLFIFGLYNFYWPVSSLWITSSAMSSLLIILPSGLFISDILFLSFSFVFF